MRREFRVKSLVLAVGACGIIWAGGAVAAVTIDRGGQRASVMASAQASALGAGTAARVDSTGGAVIPGAVVGEAGRDSRLAALNKVIADLLKPFQDAKTSARFTFTHVATNAKRALGLAFDTTYHKIGPKDRFKLALKVDYGFPDRRSSEPRLDGKLSIGLNLLNFIPQKEFNKIGPATDEMLKDILESYRQQYGDAAQVDIKSPVLKKDKNGDLMAVSLAFSARIDLTKLPEGLDPKDVPITGTRVKLHVARKGIEASCRIVANPGARAFEQDQRGLKEVLDKLLAQDPEQTAEIASFIGMLDKFAKAITEGKNPLQGLLLGD